MKKSFCPEIVLIPEQVLLGFYNIFESLLVYFKRRIVTELLICVMEIQVELTGQPWYFCLHAGLLVPKENEPSTHLEAGLQWNDTENNYDMSTIFKECKWIKT